MKHLATTLSLLVLSSASSAATYYVKTTGDDAADCLTWENACATIATAVGKAVDADIINIAEGVYKPSATVTISTDITLTGGFADGSLVSEPELHSTIISGDFDNDDVVDASGITRSYADIDGPYLAADTPTTGNTTRAFRITNASVTLENMVVTGFAGATGDNHGTVVFASATDGNDYAVTLNQFDVIGNRNYSMGNVMAYASTGQINLYVHDSVFENNFGDAGSAITLHIYANGLIEGSTFSGNVSRSDGVNWTRGYGAVWSQANVDLVVRNSLFTNNDAEAGAAIYAEKGLLIENTTFANNISTACGGAIYMGAAATGDIKYSTFYGNDSQDCGGAIRVANTAAGSLELVANLILGNTATNADANISAGSSVLTDSGYNLFGASAVSGVTSGALVLAGTSDVPVVPVEDIIDPQLADNGGLRESVKIRIDSIARDAIPNDAIPFFGVGQSAEYPFISIQQAHGAMKTYSDYYAAGVYYFDLGGSYADVDADYAFTPSGDVAKVFSTYVDADGYVLVASGNKLSVASGFTETTGLQLQSDSILSRAIFANLDFDEVRIHSDSGVYATANEEFDVYSRDSVVVQNLKDLKYLKQNIVSEADPSVMVDENWFSTDYDNDAAYITATDGASCGANSYGVGDIITDRTVMWGCGTAGLHWTGDREQVSVVSPVETSNQDSLNLWVRSNTGLCDGSITTVDSRGLPRADYVNPNDSNQYGEVHHCDIGAFEFNNGYRFDCYSEDGMRPDNAPVIDLANQEVNWDSVTCFGGDLTQATPGALLDNLGSINLYYLMMLFSVVLYRLRVRKS